MNWPEGNVKTSLSCLCLPIYIKIHSKINLLVYLPCQPIYMINDLSVEIQIQIPFSHYQVLMISSFSISQERMT